MKHILSLIILVSAFTLQAQIINPKKALERKINDRINNKIDKGLDKGLDKVEDAAKKKPKDTKDSSSNESENVNNNSQNANTSSFKTYSKYDFVTGDKVLVLDDFSQDAVGDFPANWNTNSSAEIVNIEGQNGKWLQLAKKGVFTPELINQLPENFTFEFDLVCNPGFSYYSSFLNINFAHLNKTQKYTDWMIHLSNKQGVSLTLHPTDAGMKNGHSEIKSYVPESGNPTLKNEVVLNQFSANQNKTIVHVSIWRQKQRLRVYVNEEKIWDLPKMFELNINYNSIVFMVSDMHNANDKYFISNLKLAVGAPDTRNKLITEGKFISRGIHFDMGSSVVKPQSYGAIKEIAAILKENTDVNIKIVGHTDSDGDDKVNLELSKKRAEAVKDILVKEFGIDASRLSTDGKGESEPIDKANTKVAKANNRRVELIKT